MLKKYKKFIGIVREMTDGKWLLRQTNDGL